MVELGGRANMILVAGSANLDFTVRVPAIPGPGETALGRGLAIFSGGKGANQAVSCARAGGATTQMLLALGDDDFGDAIVSSLRETGVGLHITRTKAEKTGTAFIAVDDEGENTIFVAPGANRELSARDLPSLSGCSHLLMQLEVPTSFVTECARIARREGVRVVLNAAPARPLAPDLMAMMDILIVNEGELATLTGPSGSIAERVTRLDAPCTVVTLGYRGSYAAAYGDVVVQPGFVVDAVDTTGAGDVYCGVLVAALSQGQALRGAVRRATAAAALACTRRGAQESIPTCQAIDAFLTSQSTISLGTDLDELRAYCGL